MLLPLVWGKTFGGVKKSIPRLELNRLTEGYEWAIDKIWGSMGKNGDLGQKPSFRPKTEFSGPKNTSKADPQMR